MHWLILQKPARSRSSAQVYHSPKQPDNKVRRLVTSSKNVLKLIPQESAIESYRVEMTNEQQRPTEWLVSTVKSAENKTDSIN